MEIAFIGQKGIPAKFGGVERHVHELSQRLVERGFAVTVYGRQWYTERNDSKIDGVKLIHLPSIHTKHLDTITHTALATLHALRHGFDVIHYHGVGPALWSWLPRVLSPQTTVITTFHSIDRKHEKWGLVARLALRLGEWAACRFSHHTIGVSRTICQYARDVYDRDAEYIPNAVPLYHRTNAANHLKQWGLKPDKYVLMVSRLIPHKGAHYLIKAYQLLQHEEPRLLGDTKLVIVGDGYYTDNYVRGLKAATDGNPNIVFTGFQTGTALTQLYSHARLMVHPSDKEGMPTTVLEGMSYGLPLLLSDIPEHLEFVTGDDSCLFAHGHVRSLQGKLSALLTKSSEERQRHGETNRKLIRDEYEWEQAVDRLVKLYTELLTGIERTSPTPNSAAL